MVRRVVSLPRSPERTAPSVNAEGEAVFRPGSRRLAERYRQQVQEAYDYWGENLPELARALHQQALDGNVLAAKLILEHLLGRVPAQLKVEAHQQQEWSIVVETVGGGLGRVALPSPTTVAGEMVEVTAHGDDADGAAPGFPTRGETW